MQQEQQQQQRRLRSTAKPRTTARIGGGGSCFATMLTLVVPVLLLLALSANAADLEKLCFAQRSCGHCIKANPQCAWCTDPHANFTERCQPRASLQGKCAAAHVYAPKTELDVPPQNQKLGDPNGRGGVVQLYPQTVRLSIKPGETIAVPFDYLHERPAYEVRHAQLITSDFKGKGLDIDFEAHCHGQVYKDRSCPNITVGERVKFQAKVTLRSCADATGDIAVTIVVYGYNTPTGLYITPLCGCPCERINAVHRNSQLCSSRGSIVCGQCECSSGFGGPRCECPLAQYGVSSAAKLLDKCRKSSGEPVCSGRGQCQCGVCKCPQGVPGQFCGCDKACPKNDHGLECSQHGKCDCGVCACEEGWSGPSCSCTTDTSACAPRGIDDLAHILSTKGILCSEHGRCECGRCVCDEGRHGALCEHESEKADNNEKTVISSDGTGGGGDLMADSEESADGKQDDGVAKKLESDEDEEEKNDADGDGDGDGDDDEKGDGEPLMDELDGDSASCQTLSTLLLSSLLVAVLQRVNPFFL